MWGRDDAEQYFLCTNTPDPPRREDNFPIGPPPPPPESLTVLSTDAHIREFLLYYHTIKPHLDHVPVIPQAEAIPFSLTRLSGFYYRHK